MRKPDFFVVGAAKSGTTALWEYFQQHPDIFVTKKIGHKELGYYSNQYGITDKTKYLNFFGEAQTNQLIGEVCHAYLTSELSAEWIKKDIPDAKIIMILRNPIERAMSLYNWMVMYGYEKDSTFEKALKKEEKIFNEQDSESKLLHNFKQNYHYFNSGLYYEQVKRYYEIFGEDHVLVIEYNDFKNNTDKKLLEIFKFLNVRSVNIRQNQSINASKKVFSARLQYLSRKIQLKHKRYKRYSNYILELNTLKGKPKAMKKKTFQLLKQKYLKDVHNLSSLTSIDFMTKWNIK